MNSLPDEQVDSFMELLTGIQFRINAKYGAKTIYKWRQKRLERDTWI